MQNDPNPLALTLQPHPLFGTALFAKSSDGTTLAQIETDPTKTWQVALTLDKSAMQELSNNLQDVFLVVCYVATFPTPV